MHGHDPTFIIAGAMKASTSAAAHNLNMHEDVYVVTPWWKKRVNESYGITASDLAGGLASEESKELDFFNLKENADLGIEFYKQYFPLARPHRGEASPNYFHLQEKHYEGCLDRMKAALSPDLKIIIILRDPIKRAFSHWNHLQRPEINFSTRFKGKSFNECTELTSGPKANNSLLNRSSYADNLVAYRDAFGVNNIYVTTQEAIKKDQIGEYNKMYQFLGANELSEDPGYRLHHNAKYDTTIDEASQQFLQVYFAPDIKKVKEMYPDLDYSDWFTY